MTEAEIAAGQAIYDLDRHLYGQEWHQLTNQQRAHYVRRGVAAVRAHELAVWRKPTQADRDSTVDMIIATANEGGGWSVDYIDCGHAIPWDRDNPRVRDLPPAPEAET